MPTPKDQWKWYGYAGNELKYLKEIHKTAKPDKWGWTSHFVGPFTLQTNGTAWNAFNSISGKRVNLQKVIETAIQLSTPPVFLTERDIARLCGGKN